jgi:hypothetical protein
MQKEIILDTFTLQEIKKDMRIYMYGWKSTDITENQKRGKKRIKLQLHIHDFLHETINTRIMIMHVQE